MKWDHNTHHKSVPQSDRGGFRLPPGVAIDAPKGSGAYSADELEAMGMVGVYAQTGVRARTVNQI